MIACRDCRWYGHTETQRCLHPKSWVEIFDPYNGETKSLLRSIDIMRGVGPCGIEAQLFEGKKEQR